MTTNKEPQEGCADLILGMLCLLIIIALSMLWGGYVFQTLWAWFIIPTFGAAALSLPAAMGIRIIVGLLACNPSSDKKKRGIWADVGYTATIAAIIPAIGLLAGWIVQKWM